MRYSQEGVNLWIKKSVISREDKQGKLKPKRKKFLGLICFLVLLLFIFFLKFTIKPSIDIGLRQTINNNKSKLKHLFLKTIERILQVLLRK